MQNWIQRQLRTGRHGPEFGLKAHIIMQCARAQNRKRLQIKKLMDANITSSIGEVLISAQEIQVAAEEKLRGHFVPTHLRTKARVLLDSMKVRHHCVRSLSENSSKLITTRK